MTSGFFNGDALRGLAVRVLVFLSLALLPIGLIAVVQSRQINEQSQENAKLSLLAVTERISASQERVLQEAFGAGEALGAIVKLRRRNAETCSDFLRQYRQAISHYSMVGYVQTDGTMRCSSLGRALDLSQDTVISEALSKDSRQALAHVGGENGMGPSIMVTVPVFDGDARDGMMVIAIPYQKLAVAEDTNLPVRPLALITFNTRGDVLTSPAMLRNGGQELPADVSLAAFSGKVTSVFRARNEAGERRAYAVLPLVPDAVYALSVWPSDTPILRSDVSTRLSALLPVFMWVASLVVAFWALNRLAITHIRKLVRQMRRFAINRMLPRDTLSPSVPTELVEMERAFIDMAQSILRDEAAQEDSIREKNILLKEVHHRVKNNLQLISSIMNMQIRQAKGDDAKFVLRRLQERILSLATVHENLYRNDNLVRVDAGNLLHETVNQLLAVGLAPGSNVQVTQHYEPITLDPDDAAPLTLLASEAVTNALKYISAAPGSKAEMRVELSHDGQGQARLLIENSAVEAPSEVGTGLGSKLITAFTRQLNGHQEALHENGRYRLQITFPVPERDKPVHDY